MVEWTVFPIPSIPRSVGWLVELISPSLNAGLDFDKFAMMMMYVDRSGGGGGGGRLY